MGFGMHSTKHRLLLVEDDEKLGMLANPAIQAVLMFLAGTALTLGDIHSQV